MTVRFLHTADWQAGKPLASVADTNNRARVQRERIDAIKRIADAASASGAQFVLVAGDLFDSFCPAKPTVAAVCEAIGKIGVPVFAIPGNHDHGGPGSIWEQQFFQREREHFAPNLRVLLAPEPLELDSSVLLPCPLLRRHESADTTAWLRAVEHEPFGGKPRVVIAHGSVQGFAEEDGAINRLDLARLPDGEFDYIALGDWHGTKQVAPKAWYAGTPELDRFAKGESNEPGHVLMVTATRGALPQVETIRTARLGWHRLAFAFAEDADLARLDAGIETLTAQRVHEDLLDLNLSGALGIEATGRLRQMLEAWEARLLRLTLANDVRIAPTEDEIAALTQRVSDPLISRVTTKLIELSRGSDSAEAARAMSALRELHAFCSAA